MGRRDTSEQLEQIAGSAKGQKLKTALDITLDEYKRIRDRCQGIEDALAKQGLYAFEHVDGTFSINKL